MFPLEFFKGFCWEVAVVCREWEERADTHTHTHTTGFHLSKHTQLREAGSRHYGRCPLHSLGSGRRSMLNKHHLMLQTPQSLWLAECHRTTFFHCYILNVPLHYLFQLLPLHHLIPLLYIKCATLWHNTFYEMIMNYSLHPLAKSSIPWSLKMCWKLVVVYL